MDLARLILISCKSLMGVTGLRLFRSVGSRNLTRVESFRNGRRGLRIAFNPDGETQ